MTIAPAARPRLWLVLDEFNQLSATTNITDSESPVTARNISHGSRWIQSRCAIAEAEPNDAGASQRRHYEISNQQITLRRVTLIGGDNYYRVALGEHEDSLTVHAHREERRFIFQIREQLISNVQPPQVPA